MVNLGMIEYSQSRGPRLKTGSLVCFYLALRLIGKTLPAIPRFKETLYIPLLNSVLPPFFVMFPWLIMLSCHA